MKYVVLIIDGASGWPAAALGGRTSLETARTPNLDRLAREGTVGLAHNVPEGMEASSAVACMSVMGFDPTAHYSGRGPIEAMAMGIDLDPGQVAMRCNLVNVANGRMASYSAGNISSEEASQLIAALNDGLEEVFRGTPRAVAGSESGIPRIELHAGVGFRHILTVRDGADLLATTFAAPHDITGRPIGDHRPAGSGAAFVERLMELSKPILAAHPVNKRRIAQGKLPATQIWLFWPGMRPGDMQSFSETYGGRKAALTTAVDLLRGLAVQTGVDVLAIPGVTDGGANDFEGQMAGALAALRDHDVVFVHVEAPDEASHSGDAAGKVDAIEKCDALMVPQVLALAIEGNVAGGAGSRTAAPVAGPEGVGLLVLPDHPTPLEIGTHVGEPVPFVMWGPGFAANGATAFTEKEARATGFAVAPGHLLMSLFLTRTTDCRTPYGASGEESHLRSWSEAP